MDDAGYKLIKLGNNKGLVSGLGTCITALLIWGCFAMLGMMIDDINKKALR